MDEPSLRLLRSSRHMQPDWYCSTYPDVAELGLEPALHYLSYGARMGRNPGTTFDTGHYLQSYPDAAASGLNPLVHFIRQGRSKGYLPRPRSDNPLRPVRSLASKFLVLGFEDRPLRQLEEIAESASDPEIRVEALRQLALCRMQDGTEAGTREALARIAQARVALARIALAPDALARDVQARGAGPSLATARGLAILEVLCHARLGELAAARAAYERAVLAGEGSPDLLLASVNLYRDPAERVGRLNHLLDRIDLPPIALSDAPGLAPYDRLRVATPLAPVHDAAKVTVLIAAYQAGATLPTALRSLREQTWQNLEILVLDDCSPDPETSRIARDLAAEDPRIRLVRLETNGGAYVARNRGLDEATGDYIALHDADDWYHPLRIERQVRFLQDHPDAMACLTQQARLTEDLAYTQYPHNCSLIRTNVSSLLWRRRVIGDLGGWAAVRFGADSEFIARMRRVHGAESVQEMPDSLFCFQRYSASSAVGDAQFGANGYYFGVRHEFHCASAHHLETSDSHHYPRTRANLPFPVPDVMLPDRKGKDSELEFDVIIASDFRMQGGSVISCLEEIRAQHQAGLRTGLVALYRYDLDYPNLRPTTADFRDEIQKMGIPFICFGETARCKLLVLRYPPALDEAQRHIPRISAERIAVVVNQPPMSNYGPTGITRYRIDAVEANLTRTFGQRATWYPNGPLVREALLRHHAADVARIRLSETDWSNIIDVEAWRRPARPVQPDGPLRIGRHSRDDAHKWPSDPAEILAVYPDAGNVEVHVLGGGKVPSTLLGGIPANWTVHDYGTIHPREFLAGLDIWAYFHHPDWVESFGRTIIEAMAVGVPVILPPEHETLFGDAAVYAQPQSALDAAFRLKRDPGLYARQVQKAQDHLQQWFSHDMHLQRVLTGRV